jgi:polyisoprenyl-teichoic acid--peptidoglycan teichoic acid transferase
MNKDNRSILTSKPSPRTQEAVPETQPIPIQAPPQEALPAIQPGPVEKPRYSRETRPRARRWLKAGCLILLLPILGLLTLSLIYLLAPSRTNILVLGLDSRPEEGYVSRSDTIILTTFLPLKPYVGLLSIPRDLWVNIPGYGENRINTAHFFGEADHSGGGPEEAKQAIRQDFGVNVDYYIRLRFDGFRDIVDKLGGVDVNLQQPMSGLTAGAHHLNGEQALALVRDRKSSDDFFRMDRGQLFLRSVWRQILKPTTWPRLPLVLAALARTMDTDIPVWLWPRLGLALLRVGPDSLDARDITREMVTPFVTSQGAQVLGPRWDQINPVLMQIFGQ